MYSFSLISCPQHHVRTHVQPVQVQIKNIHVLWLTESYNDTRQQCLFVQPSSPTTPVMAPSSSSPTPTSCCLPSAWGNSKPSSLHFIGEILVPEGQGTRTTTWVHVGGIVHVQNDAWVHIHVHVLTRTEVLRSVSFLQTPEDTSWWGRSRGDRLQYPAEWPATLQRERGGTIKDDLFDPIFVCSTLLTGLQGWRKRREEPMESTWPVNERE